MKKILGQKKFGAKKFWVRKKFWIQKNLGSKKIVGPKQFESAKYFESKIFGPPFLRHRVKYSGLDKWRGVGMGVPFLGFRLAYIPNLSLLESLEPFEKESKI